jgi:hypothetical protein
MLRRVKVSVICKKVKILLPSPLVFYTLSFCVQQKMCDDAELNAIIACLMGRTMLHWEIIEREHYYTMTGTPLSDTSRTNILQIGFLRKQDKKEIDNVRFVDKAAAERLLAAFHTERILRPAKQ